MSKENPYWKANVPIYTDKAVLEDLFIEAYNRLICAKFDPQLTGIQNELRIAIGDNTQALSLCADIENIYTEMLHDTCFLLAALAPHLACKPLTHESLLTDAIEAAQITRVAAGPAQEIQRPPKKPARPFGRLA